MDVIKPSYMTTIGTAHFNKKKNYFISKRVEKSQLEKKKYETK